MKLKAYLLLGISAVVLIAALVLILTNLGDKWTLHVYYFDAVAPRGLVLLLSALAGAIIYLIGRHCVPSGIRAWRTSADNVRRKETESRLSALEAQTPKK